MAESQVSAAFLRDVLFYASSVGVDSATLCRQAGFAPALLSSPDRKVPGRHGRALWTAAVEATRDPNLGLHVGSAAHPSTLGLLAPVLLNAPTLGSALDKLGRYSRLLIEAIDLRVSPPREGMRRIEFPLVVAEHNYVQEDPRQPMECTIAALVSIAGQLIGRQLPIDEIYFRHPAPADLHEHARILQAPVRFSRPIDGLRVPAGVVDWPILFSDPSLLARHESNVQDCLRAVGDVQDVTRRARQTVAELLRGDTPAVEDVARRMGMSARSLQRALAGERSTYREVVDGVRKDLALWHLRQPNISVAQVALLLGFSEPSAFHRSFKRWPGATPRTFRSER